jgi:hypothetical protein
VQRAPIPYFPSMFGSTLSQSPFAKLPTAAVPCSATSAPVQSTTTDSSQRQNDGSPSSPQKTAPPPSKF